MNLGSEVAAAWAQAIMSAVVILASGGLAVWVPRHFKSVERRELQLRAAHTVFVVLGSAKAAAIHMQDFLAGAPLGAGTIATIAAETRSRIEHLRTIHPADLPPGGLEPLTTCRFVAEAISQGWAEASEAARKNKRWNVEADLSDLLELIETAADQVREMKIGGRRAADLLQKLYE